MNIISILGSIRESRRSHLIAHYLDQRLQEWENVNHKILDLAETPLPMLDSRWEKEVNPNPALPQYSKYLRDADSIILISPEYHGSYTGVLKNALDHFWKEFERKPMGVVTTGSGRMGGINASTQMQILILSLGAYPMPYKLLVPRIATAFGEDGMPLDPTLTESTDKFIKEFVWFTDAFLSAKEKELSFLKQ